MISDKHKTVFVHIPRNAGNSIKNALKGDDFIGYLTIDEMRSLEPFKVENYYKWTVVRNPWEREMSLYLYSIQEKLIEEMNFEEYLHKLKQKEITNQNITTNQIEYFTNNGYVQVDQIVRLEYIDGTWANLCKKLSIDINTLEHNNKSNNSNQAYTHKTIDLVAEIRKKDIEFLNYDCPY